MTIALQSPRRPGETQGDDLIVELRDVFCVHRTDEGDAAALQGATLQVSRGELVCVLGPSGAGKSTLLRVTAGLQVPSAGVVNVLGWDIGRLGAWLRARIRREAIGFLDQHADRALTPELRVRDAVALPLAVRGVARSERLTRALELLESAGLGGYANAFPAELSGGERQRVALCAALAHRPALLLADEPTGELDPAAAERMRTLIAELVRQQGASAIVVSHDPGAAAFADRTVRLSDGRILSEQRAASAAVEVGGGGLVQLPPELLQEANIGGRATVRLTAGGLLIAPADDAVVITTPATSPEPPDPASWLPAELQARSLRRALGRGASRREVLRGFDRQFAPGRLTAVLGPSGVGKTTLLRLLAGLDRPDGGELLLDSQSLFELDPEALAARRRAQIGYLPQEPSPIGFLSAEENVSLSLRIRGWHPNAAAARAAVVLAWVSLSGRASQRVSRLSAGEAQRVALARALASARGLLIVDEPTSRLDRATAATVAELLVAAAVDDRQTVICATHDVELLHRAHEVLELGG